LRLPTKPDNAVSSNGCTGLSTQLPRLTIGRLINLSSIPLEDAVYSALSKGLNYAVSPARLPIEDLLTGVERDIRSLPVEAAEEVRQETVRILKVSNKPKGQLIRS
jgi:hypothetical protein